MNRLYNYTIKHCLKGKIVVSLLLLFFLCACVDDGSDKYITSEDKLITAFLEANPEKYSEFFALLQASGLTDLLSAYGTYTCFVPVNEAVLAYYAKNGTSFEQLTLEEIKELVYNHILTKEYPSRSFPSGIINTPNMADRFLYISYDDAQANSLSIYVNSTSRIVGLDQKVHNGIIHAVDAVLEPSKIQLPEIIATDPRFSLFTEALFRTGMSDSLRMMKDESYESVRMMSNTGSYFRTPPFLKYGYTALMESDSVFALNGIRNLDDLKAYAAKVYDSMFPADKNITDVADRRNSLNRFVSYHLLDRMLASNEFISEQMGYYALPNTVIYEYIESMLPNTLMEVQSGILFNKRNKGSAVRLLKVDNQCENGVYHEIDRLLVYDQSVENEVLNKRLRMDIASMIPELVTNKLRGDFDGGRDRYIIPRGYLKNMTYTEATELIYFGCDCWKNYQGDEFFLVGKYDFTLRTPPIPPGRYEIRLGFVIEAGRGVGQVYFDGQACGIPLNMSMFGDNPKVGWVADDRTSDNGVENDKMMRNRGYMKAPDSYYIYTQTAIARNTSQCLRLVIATRTFDIAEPHYLRIKSVEENVVRDFQLDYMEFVPSTYLEKEGRD
jgi:uncharacterized surface protein with fasciclin (FAS1) repeats